MGILAYCLAFGNDGMKRLFGGLGGAGCSPKRALINKNHEAASERSTAPFYRIQYKPLVRCTATMCARRLSGGTKCEAILGGCGLVAGEPATRDDP